MKDVMEREREKNAMTEKFEVPEVEWWYARP